MVVIRERLEPEGNRDKQLQLLKCDGYAYSNDDVCTGNIAAAPPG